jgi:phage gp29-like protein
MATNITTTKSKLLTTIGALPADTSGMQGLPSASSIDRMLTRFGWLGDADEVLTSVGISRVNLRSLESDEEIYSNLETRRFSVTNTPWRFEHKQARAGRFFTDAFAPHMDTLLTNLWSAVPYGYAVAEVVYAEPGDPSNPTPGKYGISYVLDVPFEWVRMLPGSIMVWRDNSTECDPRKFFACVQSQSLRKPSGEALLSKLYWPWFFRTHGWKMWAKHMERVAIPFLYGKTNSDRTSAINALSNAVQDAVFVSGKDDELTALNMGSAGNSLFPDFETAVTRRIKMAILGQTLTSGTDGGSGNRALGQVHNEVRIEKKRADSKMIIQTVQRMADALAAINGMEPPTFIMEDSSGLEVERANRDKILVDAGMVKFTPDYIKDKYALLETDFTVPEAAPANTQQNPSLANVDQAPAAMSAVAPFTFVDGKHDHKPRFTAGQQAIEDQIDNTLADFISPITRKAIASAIAGATSHDDLIDRLGVAMQDSDDRQFRQTLERALFAADLMGYGQAQANSKPAPVQASAPATIHLNAPITIQMPEQAATVVNMAAPPAPVVQVDVHVPTQPVPSVNITNEVQPAPVTVNNAFASKATQVVERDANDEIVSTVTTYEA